MKYILTGQETERLNFRLLQNDDFDLWVDFFENEEAAKFLGMDKIKTPEERCEYWFKRVQWRYDNDLGGMNVLINKATNEFIGQCGLLVQEVDGVPELEIGYSMLPAFWGQGYATEAAIKCRDYAFENNFRESIISITHIDNVKSQRVAAKNGMTADKTTVYMNLPAKIYRIHKSDWIKIKR